MLIAVYGSLRPGQYNFSRIKHFGNVEHVRTTSISGYDMFSLGPFPGIKPGEGTIVVDILNVDERVFEAIESMETGAGYKKQIVDIDGDQAAIYVYQYPAGRKVESGDWVEFTNQKEIKNV